MKSKLFYLNIGILSLLVMAPASHAMLLTGEREFPREQNLAGSLIFYSNLEESWKAISHDRHLPDDLVSPTIHASKNSTSISFDADDILIIAKKDLPQDQASDVVVRNLSSETSESIIAAKSRPSVEVAPIRTHQSRIPTSARPHPQEARVLVIDAEALNFGRIVPISNAKASWTGLESRLETTASPTGVLKSPYANTKSQRFIVNAEGYIPALGYAIKGSVAIAPMYKAELVKPLAETLGIKTFDKHIVIGKALGKNLQPTSGVRLETSQPDASVEYSMGSMGIFAKGLESSGPAGDFVAIGLDSAVQYFMPTEESEEWASTPIDLTGAPQIVSICLPKAEKEFVRTNILDGFMLEKPEGLVNLTIGGQRGVYIPEEQDLESEESSEANTLVENFYRRSAVDLFEVRAPDYLKTWISNPANPSLISKFSPLLSEGQIQTIIEPSGIHWSSEQGIVLGSITSPDLVNKELKVTVLNSTGKVVKDAVVLYFDENSQAANPQDISSTKYNHRFMIVGLDAGEWNLIAIDPRGRRIKSPSKRHTFAPGGVGSSVIRTNHGVLSYVEI